jgi:hypothetical protein
LLSTHPGAGDDISVDAWIFTPQNLSTIALLVFQGIRWIHNIATPPAERGRPFLIHRKFPKFIEIYWGCWIGSPEMRPIHMPFVV